MSSASGRTATVAAEVCRRPEDSVAGTRWTRWTPDSNLSRAKTPAPDIEAMPSLRPPRLVCASSMTSKRHPRSAA